MNQIVLNPDYQKFKEKNKIHRKVGKLETVGKTQSI